MFNFTTTVSDIQSISPYTDTQLTALSTSSIIVNTISLISCLFIIICWILFKTLRKLSYGFVFYMAIATSLRTVSKMWGDHPNEALCAIQGFLITYGGLSSFYWILSIAIVMYTIIFYPLQWSNDPNRTTKCQRMSLIINFSLPIVFAALPFFAGNYTSTGGWCWIDGNTIEGKILRWLSYYGQLVIILLVCIFVYGRIYFYLEFSDDSPKVKNIHKLYNRIKLYPLCLILGFTIAVIRRFVGLWDHNLGFGWAFAQSITTGLFGVMLFMVYGRLGKLNKLFRNKYPSVCNPFCDHFCCCLHSKQLDQQKEQSAETNVNAGVGVVDTDETKHKDQTNLEIHTVSDETANLATTILKLSASTRNVLQESQAVFNKEHQQNKS